MSGWPNDLVFFVILKKGLVVVNMDSVDFNSNDIDRLVDWLMNWLIDWSIDCLVDWLIDWLIDW